MNWWTKDPPAAAPADDWWKGDAPAAGAAQPKESGVVRGVRAAAQGATDALAATLGFPVDAATAALRLIERGAGRAISATATGQGSADQAKEIVPDAPLGGSQTWRDIFEYAGTLPRRVVDAVDQGDPGTLTSTYSGRIEPSSRVERNLYRAGNWAGGVLPAAGMARVLSATLPANTAGQGIAQTLAARPGMQAATSAIGGAVAEDTGNPWIGMAAAAAAGGGTDLLRRAITPTVRLTPDEQRIAAAALQRGIPLTPAQQTGSRGLQVMEQTLRRMPVAGNMAERGFDQQRQALNREITQLAGGAADRAGPGVIDNLYRTAGQSFDDLITRQGHVSITPQTATDVAAVIQNYGRRLPTDVARTFQSYVDDLAPVLQAAQQGQNPQVTAGWYQNVRSDLTRRLRGIDHGNPLHDALMGLRNALDDAAATTRPDLAPEWQALRQQYANLSVLDRSMRGAPAGDAAAGNVPLGQFRNAVRSADPEGFARGRGDMNELAQIAGFLQNRVPNSGTPERGVMTGLLAGGGFFEPTTAAAAVGIPTAVQAAYSSGPVRRMLTTPPPSLARDTAPVVESLMLQQLARQLIEGGVLAPTR